MMRVCMATDSLAPSGMGVHMLTLADALADCEITILAARDTPLFRSAQARFRVRSYNDDADGLTRWLRASGFDLLHLHAGIGWEGHAITRAAARAGVPVVRSEHLPYLLTRPAQQDEYRDAARAIAATIAVSDAVAASYRDSGLLSGPIATIRNGIDHAALAADRTGLASARFERIDERPVFVSVGRLAEQKNQRLLVDAVAILAARGRAVDLMLVGEGPERAALIAYIRAAGMAGHVRLMGQRGDVPALMAMATAYVHSSVFEGLPLVLLEAMALGVPIVARRAPGVDEALDDRVAMRVGGDDAGALADAMAAVLDDPATAATRAQAAIQRQATNFTAARMAAETRAIYAAHTRKDPPLNHVKIGFVGAGGIAHRHAGVLANMEDVRICAVADADPGRAGELAAQHGAQVFGDAEAMIAAGGLDAVFVCVPPFAHGPIEQAILAAGLPFLVEKPVSLDLDEATRIADAVDARGLVTAVGYHWRWLDSLDAVETALAGRRPRLVSGYWLDSTPPVEWWWQQALSGGQMVEQATHLVDLARYLCGDVTQAFGLAEHTARPAFPKLDVATASTASLRFADGAIGNFAATCLLGWNHRVGLHLFGDGFAVEITDHDVMIDTGAGRPVTPNHSDPVWRQDRAFVEAVMGRENTIRCTYRDALETLRVVDAIARSARDGQAVTLATQPTLQERAA